MSHGRKISVIGLGYVGLPVAVAFGKLHKVIGFDVNYARVRELNLGIDNTLEVEPNDLQSADIYFSSESKDIGLADFHIIAVPTPINNAKSPDLSPVLSASRTVGKQLKKGDIVVYESTVYPGATEEDCIPVLEKESGLECGKEFFVGYSPERINPGDKEHTFKTITKVVSGQNAEVLEIVASVYETVVDAGVHRAPSIKVAEAAKVIENTQRDLNIALMNELALIFDRIGIDTIDVLEAAGTKWNFLPFRPGLVGGHCIGIDPYYLTHKSSILGYIPQVILTGRNINDEMGGFVANRVIKALIKNNVNVKTSNITILGLTFKENVPDLRNTKVTDIIEELKSYGVNIQVCDPVANEDEAIEEYGIELTKSDKLKPADAVILAVPHQKIISKSWEGLIPLLKKQYSVVFDLKSILPRDLKPEGITLVRL